MPHTILLVGAGDSVRRARTRALRRLGFTVVESAHAAGAPSLASQLQPSLILLNAPSAGAEGCAELCRRLKADSLTARIPALHIHGKGEPARRCQGLEDGACLREPVAPETLAAMAAALIRAAAAERALAECEEKFSRALDASAADIAARELAQERQRQTQKLEIAALLAAGVAHDFNNLLMSVIGNASLARELLPPGHPAAALLDGIVQAGERAGRLTRQMLAYSGKGKFLVEPVSLSDLIPETLALARPSIPDAIAMRLDLAADLPPIEADRGQVQQVFLSLVLNAAEAIGANAGTISVRTGVRELNESYLRRHPETAGLRHGPYLCLEVRDTGCGMDEAIKARIFDPFFSTKFTGRGLGLAAAGGIMRAHQGAIAVDSAPGQGACFTALFPAAAR